MEPIELSLDNETMATTQNAVVLTVGGVLFRGPEILETCYFRVNLDEQFARGREVSGSTMNWWMSQSEAMSTILEAPEVRLATGRAILRDMGAKAQKVWARPGMFDLPMLRHLFGHDLWDDSPTPKRLNHGYQKENDLGTLVQEFDPDRRLAGTFVGTPHNALDDAKHHHRWLIALRQMLYERGAYTQHKTTGGQIWQCKIGETDAQLPDGADAPMRAAVEEAYHKLVGIYPKFVFSGWDGFLDTNQRAAVNETSSGYDIDKLVGGNSDAA